MTSGRHATPDLRKIGSVAVESLQNRFGEDLEAVVLFGSSARGEAVELSDLDFFVVVHGLPEEPVKRRFVVYDAMTPVSKEFKRDVSVIEIEADEIGKQITPMLINIAHDGIILYDRTGRVGDLLRRVNKAVERAGLVRYRTSDGKYGWKPKQALKPGETFKLQLED